MLDLFLAFVYNNYIKSKRAINSVGRVSPWRGESQEFESLIAHQKT